jgi:hypothetical protein
MKEIIKGYKAFDKNMKCRDFKYEVGKIYEENINPKCCDRGFHFCEYPLDVFNYYEPSESRFCEVEALGDIDKENNSDTKIATNKIKIGAEINIESLTKASIDFIYERVKKDNKKSAHKEEKETIASNTGDSSVASNTGDRSVASNTGDSSVASNTGYRSVASNTGNTSVASNTGDRSVASNTGYRSVASNTGNTSVASNTGYRSVASNTGDRSVASNTGDRSVASNTGDRSVASNTGDRSVASNTGYRSVASNTGYKGIASSLGFQSKAKAKIGNWLILAEWEEDKDYNYSVKYVKTVKVDGKKIKEDTLYELINNKFVEAQND